MAQLMIKGHQARRGTIQISGAKNASLPLMAACLLTDKKVELKNVPKITDIEEMKKQLRSYGVQVSGTEASGLVLESSGSNSFPNSVAGNKIRGSFLVLGPLLARFKEATVHMPGGCEIQEGGRPVAFHIDALVKMGAKVVGKDLGSITLKANSGLHGAEITKKEFKEITVTGTENIMMAACLAQGKTTITNAAVNPEVIDLVDMLKKMGANITVDNKRNKIIIQSQGGLLSGTTHTVIPDRIEAGTYAIAAAIVGGPLLLKMDPTKAQEILVPVIKKLREAGIQVTSGHDGLEVARPRRGKISPVHITTGPYPEFPTDLLPQWVTLMTQANGVSRIEETIYDNRFSHVPDLEKMGAKIDKISVRVYKVRGGCQLQGKHVTAKDLRGGMALVLAGLAANGKTVVEEIDNIHRGYANLKPNLKECGARLDEPEGTWWWLCNVL